MAGTVEVGRGGAATAGVAAALVTGARDVMQRLQALALAGPEADSR